MAEVATGTVTFLFTDIEGSTRHLQVLGDRYLEVLDAHQRILRAAIEDGGGGEVRTEGDSFFAVFPTAPGAIAAAIQAQRALTAHGWPDGRAVRVRMGVHTGQAVLVGSDYMGLDVHVAARIAAAGHGGQILLSDNTRALVEPTLPEGVTLRGLGRHRLKDIEQPVHLHDVLIEGLATEFPAIRSLDARPTNLPPQRTSFVGRGDDVAAVTHLLGRERLVTLTGPGGTGKTRLALKVAADHLDAFTDGVYFVDLSAVVNPALVPSAIAQALLVHEEPSRELADTLADHLRDRQILLVLDNFEQVIPAAAVVSGILDASPRLRVLATSRIPLHLSGEHEYPVPPLPVPDPEYLPGLDSLTSNEAVALFAERASAVAPGFRVTEGNAAAVTRIAARLEGLPLAIELAASRLKVLSPDELLARLEQRLPLLTGGPRDLPERQRTLRRAIEWSEDLLQPGERRMFARLSVFAGGWTLESAEAVCGPGLGRDVLEGLDALVDASLVRRTEPGGAVARFTMLETIRELASERLGGSGEEHEIRGRHAEHFRDLAEAAAPGFFYRISGAGREQGAMAARLDLENDNLRAALAWAANGGDVEAGLRTAIGLNWFWQQRGRFSEGREWLERLLALEESEGPSATRARTLMALGDLAHWQADLEAARSAYEEAVQITREVGDPALLAMALLNVSRVPPVDDEDLAWAEANLKEGLASAERAGDSTLIAEMGAVLAQIHKYRGDPAAARDGIRQAIAVHRETGALRFVSINLNRLGVIEMQLGELDAAEAHLRESLELVVEAGNPVAMAVVLTFLALIAGRRGDHPRAARLVGAVERIREGIGGAHSPLWEVHGSYGDPEDVARQAMGDEAFERVRADGFATATEQVVAEVLQGRDADIGRSTDV